MQYCFSPSEQTWPQLSLLPARADPLGYFMTSRQRTKQPEDGEQMYQCGEGGKKEKVTRSGNGNVVMVMVTGEACQQLACSKAAFEEDGFSPKAEEEPFPQELIF